MYIFLDSNILYDNWQLRNVNFTVLFNYVANENATLLLSDLVIQETENNRRKKFEASLTTIKKELKAMGHYNEDEPDYDLDRLQQVYDLKQILATKLGDAQIEYFGYDEITQSTTVARALKPLRPFREEEKGYRDTLIWLSFLKYLADRKIKEDVIFISANSNDFYNKSKAAFHVDLAKDIEEYGVTCNIIPYNSLAEFVSANIDKDEHALVKSDLYVVEPDIQHSSIQFFNGLGTEDIRKLVRDYDDVIGGFISISDHWFEIDEGIEDPTLLKTKHIKGAAVYVQYAYWLRMCTLTLVISAEEYPANSSKIRSPYNVITNEGGLLTLEIYIQVEMTVSFQYDTEFEDIADFSVDTYNLRKK